MGFNLTVSVTPPTENVKVEIRSPDDILIYTGYTDPEGNLIIGLDSTAYPFIIKAVLPDYGLESALLDAYDLENYEITFDLEPTVETEGISYKPLAAVGVAAGVFFKKILSSV